MIVLVITFLLAHLLGDFVLQPASWVAHKNTYKVASKFLYIHVLVHALLLVVLLKFDTQYWVGILTICLGHYGIDILKIYTQKQEASPKAFIVDQLAHLVLIIGVAYAYYPTSDIWFLFKSEKWLLSITSLILVSQVGAIVIRVLMSSWKLEEDSANESLKNAGMYIGIVERLMIFGFVVFDQWAAIGWLIAAKSIFRFSDLSRAKDRNAYRVYDYRNLIECSHSDFCRFVT